MTNQLTPFADLPPAASYADDPAARAFDDLRAEVSVMRRALEAVPQAIEAGRPPDYATDIARVKQAVDVLAKRIESLEGTPSLRMTANDYAREVSRAGQGITKEAISALENARRDFEKQTALVEEWVQRSREGESQNRWLYGALAFGFAGGLVFAWAVKVTFF